MVSSYTPNKNLEKPYRGDYVDMWDVPMNGDMSIIDAAFGAVTNLNGTSGSANLTATQYANLAINVTGSLSNSVTYTIPNGVGGSWVVRNATTDSGNVTNTVTIISGGGGTNVVVRRDKPIWIWSDGTNVRDVGVNSPVDNTTGTGAYVLQDSPTLTGTVNVASTTAIVLPTGTTAERPNGVTGMLRFNSNSILFEGYYGTAWGAIGGARGGGSDQIFYLNGQTVTTNYTIPTGQNAMSTGPITINSGVTVTVPSGSVWKVI